MNERRALRELTEAVTGFLTALDAEMKKPSTLERGQTVAQLCNALEIANDRVRYHVLGIDFRTDTKGRP